MNQFQFSFLITTPDSETKETMEQKFIDWTEAQGWTVKGEVKQKEEGKDE